MPFIVPVLDDRSYAQIYAELRDRIPVYNRTWTDYNDSDPAVTLLQLFAYLGETLQFRFNQIPEATKIAFLRLLDLQLRPARAASALVRFTRKDTERTAVQVYAGDIVKSGKVEFSVEDDTEVWPLDCVAVSREPATLPDKVAEPELHLFVQGKMDAVKTRMPSLLPQPYSTKLLKSDGSGADVDFAKTIDGVVWIAVLKNPEVEFDLATRTPTINIGFSPAPTTPQLADIPPCPGVGARTGPALVWQASLKTPGPDKLPQYRALSVIGDSTAGLTEEGVVRIVTGDRAADLGVPVGEVDGEDLTGTGTFPPILDDETAGKVWFWIRVWRADKSRIGLVRGICVNAAMATQAVATGAEIIGSGSGQPGQSFELSHRPVLVDPRHRVKLQVEENGAWTDWQQKEDLDASDADDRDFAVDEEAGIVHFGRRFPQLGCRVRALSYRYGGGALGNVPAKSINKIEPSGSHQATPQTLVRVDAGNAECGNPFRAEGGADSESIEQALERAPGDVRRRTRAVTRDDFSELALVTPGVSLGRAECMPLFHAPDQVSPRAGVVSVVVWPASDPVHPNAPMPDAYELRRVCEWLDTKRLVTTELYVIPPTYRQVAISIAVKVKDGYGFDAVRDWVDLILRQYLAPLPPFGPDGRGWPLGRRVLGRELEGVAMQVDGVEYVDVLRLAGRGPSGWVEAAEVALAQWEVPEVASIIVVDENTPPPPPGSNLAPPSTVAPVPIPVLREEC